MLSKIQLSNSLDFSDLYIDFIVVIQSPQYVKLATNIEKLIFAVEESSNKTFYDKLSILFPSLQPALKSAMKEGGET